MFQRANAPAKGEKAYEFYGVQKSRNKFLAHVWILDPNTKQNIQQLRGPNRTTTALAGRDVDRYERAISCFMDHNLNQENLKKKDCVLLFGSCFSPPLFAGSKYGCTTSGRNSYKGMRNVISSTLT